MTESSESDSTPASEIQEVSSAPPDVSRRRMLAGAVGGAAVLGGVAGVVASSATAGVGWKRETITFDVACLGQTWRDTVPRNPADDADFRLPFLVEGRIYPPGTVSDGFVPIADGEIGRWFCQGWLVLDGNRPEPHAASRQTFVFGSMEKSDVFADDTLITQGLEGTSDASQAATRAVGGGTGRYLAATGACRQTLNGSNTSVLDDGTDDPAPNFTFTFDLIKPDI